MKQYLQKLDLVGLIFMISAIIWYSVSNVWHNGNFALLIAGGVLIVIGVAANYRQIIEALGKRSSKYAGNYVVSLILVLAVISGLNYVGNRHLKRFDMTGSGRYTLASQTSRTLSSLTEDVYIMAFFPGGSHGPLKELLTEYNALSGRLSYEFIDPDKQNYLARQYDVDSYGAGRHPLTGEIIRYGTVIVTRGDRVERIEKGPGYEVEEEDLTNAIIKVGRTEMKKVFFIQGHEEKDPDDAGQSGYSLAKMALEAQGYLVETINLAETGMIPEAADVIIIAGPRNEPFPGELEFIDTFLINGGGALFMIDPAPAADLSNFFKNWGVQIDDNIVLDVSGVGRLMGASESMPLVMRYESHPITERFNAMSFFPMTRSIQPVDDLPYDIDVQPLFYSNENSWGESDHRSGAEVSFDPGRDLQGPLPLAVAVSKEIWDDDEDIEIEDESPAPVARMVVAGTSNFAINAYFQVQGNGNLFLNMVSWLAQDDELISIRPKSADDRRILLSQGQLMMIRLFTVFLLPGAAVVIGIIVVMRRRRM